ATVAAGTRGHEKTHLGYPRALAASGAIRISIPQMTSHRTFMRNPILLLARFVLTAVIGAALLAPPASAHETVSFKEGSAGTIVIKTNERRLYYVLGGGQAIRYPVGVGRAGKQWAGTSFIDGMRLKPAWSPPDEVRRD